MKSHKGLIPLAFILALCFGTAQAAIVYVSTSGTDSPGCGDTIPNACASIQYAYDFEAAVNDEIRVMPGTYNECVFATDIDLYPASPPSLSDRPVRIVADAWVNGSDNTATTITGTGLCDGDGNFPLPTVQIGGTNAELTGFTITGGGNSGIFSQGSVAITNNLITGNTSAAGGGLYAFAGSCYYSGDPVVLIENNTVTMNTAEAPDSGPIGAGDGGGIYVIAESNEQNLTPPPGQPVCLFRGDPDVTVSGNAVSQNNVINTNTDPFDPLNRPLSSFGAGIYILTNSPTSGSSTVRVDNNVITNNTVDSATVGFGGGIWASTFGFGTELLEVTDNQIDGNTATADGGGISAWLTQEAFGNHTMNISGNEVTNNDSGGNAGGLDLLLFARDMGVGQSHAYNVSDNEITGNATGQFSDGGGVAIEYETQRTTDDLSLSHPTPIDSMDFSFTGNTITDNIAGLGGGGMIILPTANGDPDTIGRCSISNLDCNPRGNDCNFDEVCTSLTCGIPLPSTLDIDIADNLIADNTANGESGLNPPIDVIGAGVLALPSGIHTSRASINVDTSTVAGNSLGFGFVGGVELQGTTPNDACIAGNIGATELIMDRNVVVYNGGVGLGGPPPGTTDVTFTATNNSVFGHPAQNYEAQCLNPPCLFSADPPPGNIVADPLVDPVTYFPNVCSPVFDAGAGFFRSPDTNGDDAIDGLDILGLATSFGSSTGAVRFMSPTDLNRNGVTDPTDLANMSNQFGDTCP